MATNVPTAETNIPSASHSIGGGTGIPSSGAKPPLSAIVEWLKADSLALTDGSAVSTWNDSSGNGTSYTQSGAARPIYKANIVGSLPGVLCDGVSQFMTGNTNVQGAVTVYTVFKSLANPTAGNFASCWTLHGSTGPVNSEFIFSNISGLYQPYSWRNDGSSGGNAVGIADALDTSIHALQYTYNGAGNSTPGNYTANLDNTSKSVIASSTISRTATDLSSIGARSTSGGVGSAFANMYLFERLVYGAVQSAGDQAATFAYLTGRWGV